MAERLKLLSTVKWGARLELVIELPEPLLAGHVDGMRRQQEAKSSF